MYDMNSTLNGGATKRDALVKSVSAFAVAVTVAIAGVPSAFAAQDGINRLIMVTQMKADAANTEELQANEGQAEELQFRNATVIPPTTEEMQQQKLPGRTGKAQTKKKMDGIGVDQKEHPSGAE